MDDITVNMTELNKHVKDIGAAGVLLYLHLSGMANDERMVKIRSKELAVIMNRSRTSIFMYLNRLEKSGIILRIPNINAYGDQEENTYKLLI